MLEITGVILPPNDNVPRSKKGKSEWLFQAGQFVYAALYNSQTLFGLSDWANFVVLRSYGNGQQDTSPLRGWFTGAPSNGGNGSIDANGIDQFSRNGKDIVRGKRVFAPMDYSQVSPMPKIKSIIISICNQSAYKIECNSINPSHVQKKALDSYISYYKATFVKKELEKYGAAYTPSSVQPKNEQQRDIMLQSGYFRMKFESAFEDIIRHTQDISNWGQIEQKAIEDGIDIGFKCGKIYLCEKTGATKIKYVDPALFVMQWNSQHEGKDPTFVGHIEKMSMYIVSDMMKAAGYKMEDIESVARKYVTTTTANYSDLWWTQKDPITSRWLWETLTVDVLEFEYMSTDEIRVVKKEDGYSEIDEPHHKYDDKYEKNTVYRGSYIIGTKVVLDGGPMVNNDGRFSYFWDRIPGDSITKRCRPLLDDLMKLIIKWRAEITSAAPSGYYMDWTAIANMALNPADQQEMIQQQIAAHRQTGVIVGQTITKQGKTVNAEPIRPLQNGPMNLGSYESAISTTLALILDMAGVPAILAATPTQDKGKAVRVAQQEVISGNHALFLQKQSMWRYAESSARVSLCQIRYDIQFDEKIRNYYTGVIGQEKMDALRAVEDFSIDELAITLRSLPTIVEKEELKLTIREAAMAGTRDGLKTLVESDLMFINRMIDADQLEIAEIYAANVIDERLAEYAAKAPEADKRNKDMQMELLASKEQSEMRVIGAKITLEGKVKENLIMQQGMIDSKLQAQGSAEEIEEMRAEAMYESATGQNIRNQDK